MPGMRAVRPGWEEPTAEEHTLCCRSGDRGWKTHQGWPGLGQDGTSPHKGWRTEEPPWDPQGERWRGNLGCAGVRRSLGRHPLTEGRGGEMDSRPGQCM